MLLHFFILFIFFPLHIQSQYVYTFTPAGATGSIGPTQAQVNSAYLLTNLNNSVTINTQGIQEFTIPITGPYRIEAWGAQGGVSWGLGAYISGDFTFSAGTVLKILVGQAGGSNNGSHGSGGGGSFITSALNVPYVVAGGGGGRGTSCTTVQPVSHGTTVTSGQTPSGGGPGGTLGGGGAAASSNTGGTNLIPGGNALSTVWCSGGGGFYTDGGMYNTATLYGGRAFLNNGLGGEPSNIFNGGYCVGGFGGGGGCGDRGAGGGGFSGGGGATQNSQGGGGGGSYNAGTNQTLTAGVNSGDGKVVLTLLCFITISSSQNPICAGNTATLTTNAISNYSWSTGSNIQTTVVSPTITTTYSVTGTSTLNCPAAGFLTMTVNPLPSLTVTSFNNPACAGITTTLSASGAATYTWQPGNLTGSQVAIAPTSTTVYTVTGTTAAGCTNMAIFTQSASANPVIFFATPNLSVCGGSTGTLTANGATAYTWNPGGVTGANFTVTPATQVSTYTVTGLSAAGCSANATATINILPVPTLSFTTYSITCASLGSATVNASGGTGPYSYTWTPTLQTTSVVTGLSPGTYSLQVFDLGTGCTSTATTVFNSLIPLTGTLSATQSLACNGVNNGSAFFTNFAGGSGNQNYAWDSGFALQTGSMAVGLDASTHTVIVTDALTGCIINQTFQIVQPPALTLNLSSGSPSTCAGTSLVLSGLASGGTAGYTYTWTAGPSSNTQTVSEALAGIYTYTLSSRDANNCLVSSSIPIDFVINPVLVLNSVSICPQQTGTLTVSGASTYTWLGIVTGSVLTDSPPVNTLYSVVGTALSCTSAASASISLIPAPVPVLISNSSVCNGQSLVLNASGGTGYLWSGPLSFSSVSQSTVINTVSPVNSGLYSVLVTAANGCTALATSSITVNPTPPLSVFGSTVCQTQVLGLYANSLAGSTYTWSGPGSFYSTLQNPTVSNPPLSASGLYQVTVTSAQGCTTSGSADVTVTALPAVVISNNSPLCAGNTVVLDASASTGAISSYWSGPNGFLSTTPATVISNATVGSAGQYTFVAIAGPCINKVPTAVIVYPLPAPTAGNNGPVCEGSSLSLSVSSVGMFYNWYGPSSFYSPVQNPVTSAALPSGAYTVVATDANYCQGSTTVMVTVYPKPVIVAPNALICSGSPATLVASGGNGYSWSGPLGFVSGQAQVFLPSVTNISPLLYTVSVTGPHSCTNMAVVSVQSKTLPVASLTMSPKTCVNATVSLFGEGGVSYLWKGPSGFNSTAQNPTFVPTESDMAGNYTLTVTGPNGCRADTAATLLLDKAPKAGLVSSVTQYCAPFCSEFALQPINNSSIVSTRWEIEGKVFIDTTFTYCFKSPGGYVLKTKFTNELSCSTTSTFAINASATPTADFIYSPEIPVQELDEVLFTSTSQGDKLIGFDWFFVNNDGYNASGIATSYRFSGSGIFPVALVVKNAWGCADTLVRAVTVDQPLNVFLPNSFTPNGDHLNEVFTPVGYGIQAYTLSVFDRWGLQVFHTSDITGGWDGTYKDGPCPDGTYTWILKLTGTNGKSKDLKGVVTLIR